MEKFEEFYPSEVARLVLGYLQETNSEYTFQVFLAECQDLAEHYRHFRLGKVHSTNINGKSLHQILQEYCQIKYELALSRTRSLNYTSGRNKINSRTQSLDLSQNCNGDETELETDTDLLPLTSESSESEFDDPCTEIDDSTSDDREMKRGYKESNLMCPESRIQTSRRDSTRSNKVYSNLSREESTGSSVRDSSKPSRTQLLPLISKRSFVNQSRLASQEKVELFHKMVQTDSLLTSDNCVQTEDVVLGSDINHNTFSDQKLQNSEKEINSRISDLSIINVTSCGLHFWNSLNKRKSCKPKQRFPGSFALNKIADYKRGKDQGMLPVDLIISEEILRYHPLVQKITDYINSALPNEEIVDLCATKSSSSVTAQNISQTESIMSSALDKCEADPVLLQCLSFLYSGENLSDTNYFYYRCNTRHSHAKHMSTNLETNSNEPNARISSLNSLVKIKNNTNSKLGIVCIDNPVNQHHLASSEDQEYNTECNLKESKDITIKTVSIGTPFETTMDTVLQRPVAMSLSNMTVTSIENGEDGNVITTLTNTDNLTILPTIPSSSSFFQPLSTVGTYPAMPIFVPNTASTFPIQNNFQYRFVVNPTVNWSTPAQDVFFPLQTVGTENIAPQPLILSLNGSGSETGTAIMNSGNVTTNGSGFETGAVIMKNGNVTTNGIGSESGTVTMDSGNVMTNSICSDDVQTATQKEEPKKQEGKKKKTRASTVPKTSQANESANTARPSRQNKRKSKAALGRKQRYLFPRSPEKEKNVDDPADEKKVVQQKESEYKSTKAVPKMNYQPIAPKKDIADTENQFSKYILISTIKAVSSNEHVTEQTSLKSLISSAKLLNKNHSKPNSVFARPLEFVEDTFEDEADPLFPDMLNSKLNNGAEYRRSSSRLRHKNAKKAQATRTMFPSIAAETSTKDQVNTKEDDLPVESVKNNSATSTECFIEQETQQKSQPTSMTDAVLCAMQAALGMNFSALEIEEDNISNSSMPSTMSAVLERELINDFDNGTLNTIEEQQENYLLAIESTAGSTDTQNPLSECKLLKVASDNEGVDHSNQFILNSLENEACPSSKNSLKSTSTACGKLNETDIASKSDITNNCDFDYNIAVNDLIIDLTPPMDDSEPLSDDMCIEVSSLNKNSAQLEKKVESKSMIAAKDTKNKQIKQKPVVPRNRCLSSEKSISDFQSFRTESSDVFIETLKHDECFSVPSDKNSCKSFEKKVKPARRSNLLTTNGKTSKGNTSKTKNLKTRKASAVKDSVNQSKSLKIKVLSAPNISESHDSEIEVSVHGKQSELCISSLHEMAIEKKALDSTVDGNRKTSEGKKSNSVQVDNFTNKTDTDEELPLIFLKKASQAKKKTGQKKQTKLSNNLVDAGTVEDKALNLIVDDKRKTSKKKLYNAKTDKFINETSSEHDCSLTVSTETTESQTEISACKKLPKPCSSLVHETAVGDKETLNSTVDDNRLASKKRLNLVAIDKFINTTDKDEDCYYKVPLENFHKKVPIYNYLKNNKSVSKKKQLRRSTKKTSNTNLNVLNHNATSSEELKGDDLSSMNISLMDETLEKNETRALNSDAVDSICKNSAEPLTKTISIVIERLSSKTLDDVMYPAEVEHVNELNSVTQPEFFNQNFPNTSQSEKDVTTNHGSVVVPPKKRVRSLSDTSSRSHASLDPVSKLLHPKKNSIYRKQSFTGLGKMAFQNQEFPITSDTSGSTKCLESLSPDKNLLIDASHSNVINDSEQTSMTRSKRQNPSEKEASSKCTNKKRPNKKFCDSLTVSLPQDNLTPQSPKDLCAVKCSISPDKTPLTKQELNQEYTRCDDRPSRKREISPGESFLNSRTSSLSESSMTQFSNSKTGSKVKNTDSGNNLYVPSQTLISSRILSKHPGVSPLAKKLKVSSSSYACFESQSTMLKDEISSKNRETVSTPSVSRNLHSNAHCDSPRQSPSVSRKSTPKSLYGRSCAKYLNYFPTGVRLPLKFMYSSKMSPSWIQNSKVERNTEQPKRVLFSPKELKNKNSARALGFKKPGKKRNTAKTPEPLTDKNAKSSQSETDKYSLQAGRQEIDIEIKFSNKNEQKQDIDKSELMSSKSKSPIFLSDCSHLKNKYLEKESLTLSNTPLNLVIENDNGLVPVTNKISLDTFDHLINLKESGDSIENLTRGVKDIKTTSSESSGVSINTTKDFDSSKHLTESNELNVIPITSGYAAEEEDMPDDTMPVSDRGNKTNAALHYTKVPYTEKTDKTVCTKFASPDGDLIKRKDFAHNSNELVKLKLETSVEKGKLDEPASSVSGVVKIEQEGTNALRTQSFCSSIATNDVPELLATGTKQSDSVCSDNKFSTFSERYPTCDSKKLISLIDLDSENSDSFDEAKEPHAEFSRQLVPKKETTDSLLPSFPNVEESPPCLNIELPQQDSIPSEDAKSDESKELTPEEENELKLAIESIAKGDSSAHFKSPPSSVNLDTYLEKSETPASLDHNNRLSSSDEERGSTKKRNFQILKKKIQEYGVRNILVLLEGRD